MLLQKTCHDGLLTRCRASAGMSFFGKRHRPGMCAIPGKDQADT